MYWSNQYHILWLAWSISSKSNRLKSAVSHIWSWFCCNHPLAPQRRSLHGAQPTRLTIWLFARPDRRSPWDRPKVSCKRLQPGMGGTSVRGAARVRGAGANVSEPRTQVHRRRCANASEPQTTRERKRPADDARVEDGLSWRHRRPESSATNHPDRGPRTSSVRSGPAGTCAAYATTTTDTT